MAGVILSSEKLTRRAKDTLGKFPCEWKPCHRMMNCWNMLEQHLILHCGKGYDPNQNTWFCHISACSARLHPNLSALTSHVRLSHMARISVPCPILGCSQEPKRLPFLDIHMQNLHPGLLDGHVLFSELKPTYAPSTVGPLDLPPLPLSPISLTLPDLLPVRPGSLKRKHVDGVAAGHSRKWSRLMVQDEEGKDERDDISLDLEDLPMFPHQRDMIVDIVSRQKPQENEVSKHSDLSKPARMVIPPPLDISEAPVTILYDTFSLKVDEQEAAEEAAAKAFSIANGTSHMRTVTIRQPS